MNKEVVHVNRKLWWFLFGCALETIVCWFKWGRNRNTKMGAPSASHNNHYEPCLECDQLMCGAKTYYGSPECYSARGKHST